MFYKHRSLSSATLKYSSIGVSLQCNPLCAGLQLVPTYTSTYFKYLLTNARQLSGRCYSPVHYVNASRLFRRKMYRRNVFDDIVRSLFCIFSTAFIMNVTFISTLALGLNNFLFVFILIIDCCFVILSTNTTIMWLPC